MLTKKKYFYVDEYKKILKVNVINLTTSKIVEYTIIVEQCIIKFNNIEKAIFALFRNFANLQEQFEEFKNIISTNLNFNRINFNWLYVEDVQDLKELNEYCELFNKYNIKRTLDDSLSFKNYKIISMEELAREEIVRTNKIY